ncbi:MAG: cysteine--tRNA ligase [Pseudomonadota bacterium]|nr:cysteine--tRNA ligase [Pseudomonadota bacterium]
MVIALYCSQTRLKKHFKTLVPGEVSMYVCGPTVYSEPHIGNARSCVVFDTLYRVLKLTHEKVKYCRNITDVDDKINQAAMAQGVPIHVIAEQYEKIYLEDCESLGCLRPTIEPKATQHIKEMIDIIKSLIIKGHAYTSEGHVLFSVPSYQDYGQLSKRTTDARKAGARVAPSNYKQDPNDFILWKPSNPHEPGWDSPWGYGRPGWHIECTAMIEKHLGLPIDIHGGGSDLMFPHHENECAQGVCHSGQASYAQYWVHNGMVHMGEDKMSKSLGNILTVRQLLKQWPGEVLRLAMLQTHYRQPLAWTENLLTVSRQIMDKAYRALDHLTPTKVKVPQVKWTDLPPEISQALEDDLNTPLALSHWQRLIKESLACDPNSPQAPVYKQALLASQQALGLGQVACDQWFGHVDAKRAKDIESLIQQRAIARAAKDFTRADDIRDQLSQEGIVLEDHHGVTTWRLLRTSK